MTESWTRQGSRVRHPAEMRVQDLPSALEAAAAPAGRRPDLAVDLGLELEAIVTAAESQEMVLSDAFAIVPATALERPRGAMPAGTAPLAIDVPLASDEAAILLVECEGVYAWQLPEAMPPAATQQPAGVAGVASFALELASVAPDPTSVAPDPKSAAPSPAARPQGLFRSRSIGGLLEPIRAVVLKFIAGRVIDHATGRLEEHVSPGLVHIRDLDPAAWRVDRGVVPPVLPPDRPARLLLFVHGTFSSTRGSFASLASTAAGRAWLEATLDHYDLVLGFDHPTLSSTPEANAAALLEALRSLPLAAPPVIDAVAFSRGGLVFRALAELLLPGAGWPADIGRAVFVGCTHGGTTLASPANWQTLLDLYTNVAIAGARALSMLGAGVVGGILGESVKTLSGLARAIVVQAIADERVPGLAAMRPASPLVQALADAPLRPGPAASYFTVTADFSPDPENPPPGMGRRLLLLLADRTVDRLMGEANDLVVEKAAMTALGAHETCLEGGIDLLTERGVYHTIYFAQPEVIEGLACWLGRAATGPAALARTDSAAGAD